MKFINSNFFIPSFNNLFFLILLIVLIFYGSKLLGDADTGYHIRAGEYIIENKVVPKNDIFSFLNKPIPWTAHEWLSEVIMEKIHRRSGLSGVVLFYIILIALSFSIFFNFNKYYSQNIIVVWVLSFIATACTSVHWLARPHVFSFLFTICWYFLLDKYNEDYKRNKKVILFLPLIMVFWVNIHGGFMLGFFLYGVYFFSDFFENVILSGNFKNRKYIWEKQKIYIFVGVSIFIASLLNPFGYQILLFPFKLLENKTIMTSIIEFMPTNIQIQHSFRYLFFFSFAVLLYSKKRLDLKELILVIMISYMALYSVRYIAIFPIIILPVVLKRIDLGMQKEWKIFQTINKLGKKLNEKDSYSNGILYSISAVLILAILVNMGYLKYGFDSERHPVDAVEFLKKEKINGNMYNNDEFGDYLIYKAYPDYKVFFDGRNDMYGEEHHKKYIKVFKLENNWEDVIEEYEIKWIFFNADSLLSRYLNEKKDWHLIYADKIAHIYVKKIPENKYLVEKYYNTKPVVYDKKES